MNFKLHARPSCGSISPMPDEPPFIDPVDDCPWLPARELYRQLGFVPPPPSAVDDFQLRGRLWEFIHALAGRRFWLDCTDHLSDRELYVWLHDVWFEQTVADIPPAAEWNTRINVTEYDTTNGTKTWLRFFADDKDREQWTLDFSEDEMPPREAPPYDRDRWLPEPFYPPTEADFIHDPFPDEADMPGEPGEATRTEADPLGLEAIDAAIEADQRRERARREREEREAKHREQLAALTGGESTGWQRPIHKLTGPAAPLPPAELTDDTLHAKLWELLHNLACQGFYVLNTNHLSDRELYTEFWQRGLRDAALLPGKIRTGGWYHDCIGSGSEEDIELSLRYFSTERDRADWHRQFPDDIIPPRETPHFNRDWRLPKGPTP